MKNSSKITSYNKYILWMEFDREPYKIESITVTMKNFHSDCIHLATIGFDVIEDINVDCAFPSSASFRLHSLQIICTDCVYV